MLLFFLIGVALGAGTGVPPGAVNLAVINAAYRHTVSRALAVGFGGMLGDVVYASLGILGLGPIFQRHPSVPPFLYAASGAAIIVYGALNVRLPPPPLPTRPAEVPDVALAGQRHVVVGFTTGVGLLLLNPSAIVTWVVIVGSFMTGASQAEGIAAVAGIGTGSFGWFAIVTALTRFGKNVLGEKTELVPRIVGVLLVGYGLFSIGRAVHYWLS